ncbi:cobalt ECF transporter T component CbiQ [Geomonas paludis]|uniref:Cobalt ECF transporter T component CbiQ n=1 Tax=Geomonas paludis TaxID=2740185 RepID=A0A6V8N091_9BACT|nr:cobalt ECF transporter T component CbiQ [Geomonas paludis]GFO65750.1 cobalt ECF transporter T component CbiQ [Geomonas paludis]
MHHHFNAYRHHAAHPLASVDARVKLVSALALLVMVLSAQGVAFPLAVAALGLALCLHLGTPLRILVLRFSEPLFIAVMVLALKTFFSGTIPMFSIGVAGWELVGHRDGLAAGLLIAGRIMGGVSLLAVVGFSTPFTELMAALSWLRVPQVLVDVALFAWRYLFLLLEDAQVVYNAQKNRLGYVGCRRALSSLGTLAGILVIKAFDNSQSITTAMVQRGYDGAMPASVHRPLRAVEVGSAFLLVSAIAVLRLMS